MTLARAYFITILCPQLKVWPDYDKNKLTVGELWLGFLRYVCSKCCTLLSVPYRLRTTV